jgi:hypothetical protein
VVAEDEVEAAAVAHGLWVSVCVLDKWVLGCEGGLVGWPT